MDAPELKTPLPGPKAKALIERDAHVVSTSYTRDYPFVMARGEGAVVEDVDGNRFLDCAAGIAVNSTGHSHPQVVAAIIDQAHKFLHMSGTDFYYEPQVRLAEVFNEIAPIRRAEAIVLRQLRNGGERGGDQAGALHDEAVRHHRVPGQLPRPDDGVAVAHLEPGHPAQGIRAAAGGRVSRAVCELLPVPGGPSPRDVPGRMPGLRRGPAAGSPDFAGRGRGGDGGIDPGRGRLRGARAAVPSPAARVDVEARHPVDLSTKCSRAWAARGRCSASSTSACSRTS